ncbi:MAG: DUF1653 domain-containing protein [Haliea sp.]|nr:DUF1653 domain-containing protein [Haliea sp.]
MGLKTGKYRHFKGGEYAVYGVATHSETEESMVVYRPLYGEGGLWVRPLAIFEENVERDGKRVPRFTFVESMELTWRGE